MLRTRICDNRGKHNPARYMGSDRLCGEKACLDVKGCYKRRDAEFGTNGRVNYCKLRLPIQIRWVGWWSKC